MNLDRIHVTQPKDGGLYGRSKVSHSLGLGRIDLVLRN